MYDSEHSILLANTTKFAIQYMLVVNVTFVPLPLPLVICVVDLSKQEYRHIMHTTDLHSAGFYQ